MKTKIKLVSDVKRGESILEVMKPPDTLNCRLCGEARPEMEIINHGGDCAYCDLQNERAERYFERQHPDEK
jgi:hypothetical protein